MTLKPTRTRTLNRIPIWHGLTFGNQQISKQIWSVHMAKTREGTELWYFVSNLIK